MNTTLLIMAAGIGSRFGTGIKQLEPVDMRFTVENETGKTVHEYLLPNYVASCCKEIGIDGIRYRSTGYNCCVLWKDDYFEYAEGSREVIPE